MFDSEKSGEDSINIIVGCTGSVASVKVPVIVKKLNALRDNVKVCVVATEKAVHFFDVSEVEKDAKLVTDETEWNSWKQLGDRVLHIDLRRWAHLLLIAPLDANTMGKLTAGICDNLLTCLVRAWDPHKPLLFCPAMNTYMWEHPITSKQISDLKGFGYYEVPCIAKRLACQDVGMGAMAEVDDIIKHVSDRLDIL